MITREFVESLNFSAMSELDGEGFLGASKDATLASFEENGNSYTVVKDGNYVEVICDETLVVIDSVDDYTSL